MPKKRKTKREKIRTSERRGASEGFAIKDEWLKTASKNPAIQIATDDEKKYFRRDLTKTLILTMLVLALELALWQYLSRQ